MSASEARSQLFPLIQQVNAERTQTRTKHGTGDAVLMSADDWPRRIDDGHRLAYRADDKGVKIPKARYCYSA
ncbi:MAG TPA: type II toxin-antitoxin system prevent-host-death family antitoxin [Actinocrinis sp.]|uniref:type II toxin-antitoxin system prevent-host-death family antitoxin n=1 Tax=Actinocrinis sp. TaxID=1920516 RepID=UPI002DDD9906|nr:type II toxin-antitoxin system prevent-host-death family antitoxin [Actinocrinis sp.]HEV2346021.1 type II toxin-antitoxin system prevent-host-death family antitoxin [Actinocrinis sp.]